MSHSSTPQARNRATLTVRSSSLRCVSAAEHETAEQYSNTPKKRSIMEHSPRLPQDTKTLRSCSGNRAKMLLKGHLWIKCHSQNNKVIRFLQYSSANSQWGWLGMHCARPRDYHSLGLTSIQFHPSKVTPLTNPAKVTDQGLSYCNSDAWGRHNSHQSGVISITDQLIFQNGKKLRRVQEEQ